MGRQPGHRQRGAGAVTVSRGDVERQGVLCKEWQRTPLQLLNEYCQSKKRRNAFYPKAKAPEGRFRVRCVLPDDKNSAKDLKFCPTQDFDSLDEAKHCAALLALHYVEPLRPLERKLPDPYRELWLTIVASAATTTDTKASSSSNNKKPVPPAAAKAKKSNAAVSAPVTTTAVSAGDSDDSSLDLWGDAPEPVSVAATPAKTFPSELTADRTFASHAAFERAKLERVQERNKRTRQRENRARANEPKHVLMSAACRDRIERVLRSLGTISTSDAVDGDGDDEDSATTDAEADALDARVASELQAIGFQHKHVNGALQACRRDRNSDADSDVMTRVLDWLCLHVPEGDLPKGFNPAGTQLDVVRTTGTGGGGLTDFDTSTSPILVQRVMKYGYDRRDAVTVVNAHLRAHPEDAGVTTPTPELCCGLLQALHPHQLTHFGVSTGDTSLLSLDADEVAAQRQDEVLALEAIYDDKFCATTLCDAAQTQRLVLDVSDDVQLEVFVPAASQYPHELPIIGLTTTNAALQPYLLLASGHALKSCASALGEPMVYDICVAVDTVLAESAHSKARAPAIVLLPDAKPKQSPAAAAMKKPQSSLPPPAPIQTSKTESRLPTKKTSNKKRVSQAPRRVDPATVKRLSDALALARERKAQTPEFQQMQRARAKLPAAAETRNVIELLAHHQVLLVCGQTGCGKTTQVPQFILDDFIAQGRDGACNIVCTQPRRIAAIGVATRVAQERCEAIADVVGYQIRMEAKKSANTRLLFCTTGVLLRRLLSDRQLAGVSHIIVDEVHERNIDTDFLLSILRDLLPQRPDLRLVLMSATMNASLFVDYFASVSRAPCPVLDIPGFTFPVDVKFLDDILALTRYDVPKKLVLADKKKTTKKPSASDAKASDATVPEQRTKQLHELSPLELADRIDDTRIDYDLVAHLVTHLVTRNETAGGAILVFLPGTAEIKRLIEMLTHTSAIAQQIVALPLHGALSGADQALVFRAAPTGKTKIIVSTNIAETSITINDITVVIDCGKVKEMVYDSAQRRSQLLDCWAAQAACDQRKGRAGRVQAGTCYRVFARKRFAAMAPQLSAEIHRVSLEQLCLQIKKLDLGSIRGFLAKAIEPPQQAAIDAAMAELVEIAAFKHVDTASNASDSVRTGSRSDSSQYADEEVVLTPLGSHLAMLPLDARIGKFLVYGSILRCIEPVAIIAACISSKNPFVMSLSDPELQAKQAALKKDVDGLWKSDHLLLWKVVERYLGLRGQKLRRGFCKDYGLSFDTLESIADLKTQYLTQLDAIGFYDARRAASLNANANVPRIVKAALCAGLYGNVAQVVYPEQKYFQAAHGVVTEDHDAKKIRYFVKSQAVAVAIADATPTPPPAATARPGSSTHRPFVPRERVFLHPSSHNFAQTQYDSPWLLYTSLVQTSKVFVRESTMVSPYALLLFGGALDVLHEQNVLRLDAWIEFSAVARIGVLIKAIRKHLDELLAAKIEDPALDIAQSELVSAISHLLQTEGM